MATLLLVAAAIAATVAAQRAWPHLKPHLRRGRQVECDRCWQQLPASRAITIANTTPTPDQITGPGGSAIVAHYHRRCARQAGVLDQPHDHQP